MTTEEQIQDAWLFLRTSKNSIPVEVIDFMRDASIKELRRHKIYFPETKRKETDTSEGETNKSK